MTAKKTTKKPTKKTTTKAKTKKATKKQAKAGGLAPTSGRAGRAPTRRAPKSPVTTLTSTQIEALRSGIEEQTKRLAPATGKWNANPEDVQKSVAQLVLTLVEFLRQLMERQAIRRMEAGTFTDDETERVGVALMKLEETIAELCDRFGLKPEELQLQLGPLGRLI